MKKMSGVKKMRCSRCLITLEKLKKDGVGDFLVKVVDENKKEKYLCRVCFEGW
jgi:uncharacterized protein with PIN domain